VPHLLYCRIMSRNSFRAGSIACVIAWCCGIGAALVAHGVNVQPTETVATKQEVLAMAQQHTHVLLGFMAFDMFFVIGYVTVFAVVFLTIAKEDRLIGGIGLGAGILGGLADMAENTLYVVYAMAALHGNTELAPSLPLHYYLTGLKWMAGFAGVGMQLLVFPRRTALERSIVAVMCTFPVSGAISIAWPALMPLRIIFALFGLPLLAVYFHRRFSEENTALQVA
jgi:hypothetical protein